MPNEGVSIMAVQKVSRCTKRCLKCKHHTTMSGGFGTIADSSIGCLYILDKLHIRGCPAGDECDKYDEGKTVRRFKSKEIKYADM